jgi:hypothetical protein
MDIKPYDVVIKDEPTSVQKLYRFPNGAGASVIRGEYTYGGDEGLWELAVIRFEGEGDNYRLIYPKDVCSEGDVVGWLTDEEVDYRLVKIANLTEFQITEGERDFKLMKENYDDDTHGGTYG